MAGFPQETDRDVRDTVRLILQLLDMSPKIRTSPIYHLTPYPGTLGKVAESRRIVGFDVCELAPGDGPPACSYTAAKLVYKLVAYSQGHKLVR